MKIKYIARSRHKNSTEMIQVVYNFPCFYSRMKVAHSVAESFKCKLLALQCLKMCTTLHQTMFNMVHEIYNMANQRQTMKKGGVVLTDTKRIKVTMSFSNTICENVHIFADKQYKRVHPMSMWHINTRS